MLIWPSYIIPVPQQTPSKPNILVIVSDDQTFHSVNYTPKIKQKIFGMGATFQEGYVSTSLCCPSRATIWTGLFAHNHGDILNEAQFRLKNKTTIFEAMAAQNTGYRLAHIGKPMNNQIDECRPEFDYYASFVANQVWYNYLDTPNKKGQMLIKNVGGTCHKVDTFASFNTYYIRDLAIAFMNNTINEGKQFALYFAPFNPHPMGANVPPTIAPGDENLYSDGFHYYLPPSFNEADITDKPSWLQKCCTLAGQSAIDKAKALQLAEARNLASLDRSVDQMLDFLESKGQLSNTLIIYISDNGLFNLEHRLTLKNHHYKEGVNVPMAMRWDGHVPVVNDTTHIVGNIDIAPTIYDVLDIEPPYPLDGRSLMEIWDNNTPPWRTYFLTEHWVLFACGPPSNPSKISCHVDASIITRNWTYTETFLWNYSRITGHDRSELYDRINDPYELNNLAPANAKCVPQNIKSVINELGIKLRILRPDWDQTPSKTSFP